MEAIINDIIQFDLPADLACPKPTEQRNIKRDEVRLLVSNDNGKIQHDFFYNLEQYLNAGDVLVVNTSATMPAAIPVTLPNGQTGMLHLSTPLKAKEWLVEIRAIQKKKTIRWKKGEAGMAFDLPGKARLYLKQRFYKNAHLLDLWVASLDLNQEFEPYLKQYGQPIKYVNPHQPYPLSYYQTIFSFQQGSAEMPSAGRAFTQSLLQNLAKRGVTLAPILLHTGVSSLEENEKPYPEYVEVLPTSALQLNRAKAEGRRIIAVGTTAIRAIESAVNTQGTIEAFQGYTDLYIDSNHEMNVANGLITGFHEPKASHLNMLQSLAGAEHIEKAYQEALKANYYWHEFGDLHLILGR